MSQLWEIVMEVIVKNTMTNTWGKTQTKTDKDKNMENKIIPAKFSSQLQRYSVAIF